MGLVEAWVGCRSLRSVCRGVGRGAARLGVVVAIATNVAQTGWVGSFVSTSHCDCSVGGSTSDMAGARSVGSCSGHACSAVLATVCAGGAAKPVGSVVRSRLKKRGRPLPPCRVVRWRTVRAGSVVVSRVRSVVWSALAVPGLVVVCGTHVDAVGVFVLGGSACRLVCVHVLSSEVVVVVVVVVWSGCVFPVVGAMSALAVPGSVVVYGTHGVAVGVFVLSGGACKLCCVHVLPSGVVSVVVVWLGGIIPGFGPVAALVVPGLVVVGGIHVVAVGVPVCGNGACLFGSGHVLSSLVVIVSKVLMVVVAESGVVLVRNVRVVVSACGSTPSG